MTRSEVFGSLRDLQNSRTVDLFSSAVRPFYAAQRSRQGWHLEPGDRRAVCSRR